MSNAQQVPVLRNGRKPKTWSFFLDIVAVFFSWRRASVATCCQCGGANVYLAQPFRCSARVSSLWLWPGAHFNRLYPLVRDGDQNLQIFFFDSPGSQVSGCIAWRGVRGSLMETCPGRSLRQPEFASTGKKGRVETSGGEKTSPNLLTRNLVPAMQIYNFLTTSAG